MYVGKLEAQGTRLSSLRQATADEGMNYPYAWAPDSRTIFLLSNRDGPARIYRKNPDNDSIEQMTSGPGVQNFARVSPDGRWLIYSSIDERPTESKTRLMRIPLEGGTAQEILATNGLWNFECSRIAERGCILFERRELVQTVSLFDPLKGRGREILDMPGETTAASFSPDGRHIAFVPPGGPQNRIRIVDLHGATESEITVDGAASLITLDSASDGSGFFSGDVHPTGTRLLHIQRDGKSQILWSQTTNGVVYGIPSPDGRRLATFKPRITANVWMVENP